MVPRKEVWIMLQYYMTDNGRLQEIDAAKDGCWISMVAPVEKELEYICRQYDLPDDVLKAALDTDERSRIEVDDNYTMVLVNIPTVEEQSDRELYSTIPMAILIVQDAMITVCSENSPVIRAFSQGKVKDFNTFMKSRFILQFLYRIDTLYLRYLRDVDKKSDEIEDQLHQSTKNSELIELLQLEKSLVYFTTALRSNEAVLEKLLRTAAIGVSTGTLGALADTLIRKAGGDPIFRGYGKAWGAPPFPAAVCVSLNNEVVHGIPDDARILADGDLLKIDIGMRYQGMVSDMARMKIIGSPSPETERIKSVTEQALQAGMETLHDGSSSEEYAAAVESVVRAAGFSCVRDLVGHGVGHELHEDPQIPNYKGSGLPNFRFVAGMTVALEPMVNAGDYRVKIAPDGWTFQTSDGRLSGHMENSVLITADGYEVLTGV